MYARYEFTLAPTFDTYTEIIQFLEHAGIKDRNEKDKSPRRPLTAVSTSPLFPSIADAIYHSFHQRGAYTAMSSYRLPTPPASYSPNLTCSPKPMLG